MTSKDTTFTTFTAEQAAAYAATRGGSYPKALYDAILDYHTAARDVAYDVGTGPGKVAFDLAHHFKKVLGSDPGVQMIEQARKDAETFGISDMISFAVAGAENCAEAFPNERVDLMTVAMAAHWFDLPKFYQSAAKILKPGGTLALWTLSSQYIHPSTPNHERIQEILSELEDGALAPHRTPGHQLTRNAYRDLKLPWDIVGNETMFDEGSFQRKDWDLDGVPSAPPLADGSPGPFMAVQEPQTIEQFGDAVGSASMVVKWRDANPEKALTEEDPVNVCVRKLREVVGGDEKIWISASVSLLLLRRA